MEPQNNNSFLQYAVMVSAIIALVSTVVSLIISYRFIASEPTGSFFSPMTYMGIVMCLIMALTGLVTVWYYIKETGAILKPGKGAVIGMVSGLMVALFVTIFAQIWYLFDPTYADRLIEAMIANAEAMQNIPEDAKQQMIDAFYEQGQEMKTLWGVVKGFLMNGTFSLIANALTGILGVVIFSKKAEETL